MKRTLLIAVLIAASGAAAAAQVKTIPGEMQTTTATIEAIDRTRREVTIKQEDGTHNIVVVPKEVTRFDAMAVGDTITAKSYDNIVLRVKHEGEAAADSDKAALTPREGPKPGGTAAVQRTMTVTITKIDPNVPWITFTGPNNWSYSGRVQDKDMLAKVKVGDKVDITWTEALMVAVDTPAPKK